MKMFFFGCGDGSSKKAFEMIEEDKFNIMINYASKCRSVPKNYNRLFIDSGGYSFVCKEFDYTTSHEHYLDFVRRKRADFFANRDYPCEQELLKKRNVTIRDNQIKTIDNQLEIMGLLEGDYYDLKDKFVAVIQGWDVEDYLWMIDYMREQGLLTNLMGVGSVCRKHQEKQVRNILNAIRSNLSKKYKLHAFGVKFSVLKYKDVWDALYSVDSCAYRYRVRKNYVGGVSIKIQIKDEIEAWVKQIQNLQSQHDFQKTIEQFESR